MGEAKEVQGDRSLEVRGVEFDWFAVDQEGQFALFATSGEGHVPDEVIAHHEQHSEIGDTIPVTGWGSDKVWESYSKIGLFVYDWDRTKEIYVRLAEPIEPMNPEFAARINACPTLQRLQISFKQAAMLLMEEIYAINSAGNHG